MDINGINIDTQVIDIKIEDFNIDNSVDDVNNIMEKEEEPKKESFMEKPSRKIPEYGALTMREFNRQYARYYYAQYKDKWQTVWKKPPRENPSGRPRLHDLEAMRVVRCEDGKFHCLVCNSKITERPERHVQTMKCRLVRALEESKKLD